jgi:alkylation response protein AidB-like acyl-CoA dehydrogenase
MIGGEFLTRTLAAEDVFTPEDFNDEHRAVRKTVDEFWRKEAEPVLDRIAHKDHDAAVGLLRKSCELGLTGVVVPEVYGGMEMDLTSAMIVAEGLARDGSYAGWHGAHAGIGTLPVLLFGTEEQKQVFAEAGGRGVDWRVRADGASGGLGRAGGEDPRGSERRRYALCAERLEDVDHERGQGGSVHHFREDRRDGGQIHRLSGGAFGRGGFHRSRRSEDGHSGLVDMRGVFRQRGRARSNVLGEIGRGHIIAFNILNLGRLKLGPFAVGGAKQVLKVSAATRRSGRRSADPLPLRPDSGEAGGDGCADVRRGDAELRGVRVYRVPVEGFRLESAPDAARVKLKAIEEFAAECSMVKVYASEVLDYVVDEGVQIHGGYGYHQDYLVERAYRDSRINRIFEGTNEINRLLATGMLLKRAMRGQLDLVGAVKRVQAALMEPPSPGAPRPPRPPRASRSWRWARRTRGSAINWSTSRRCWRR